MQVSTAGNESASPEPSRQGLQLDRVVLLGRSFDEYRRYFALDEDWLRGKTILDVASGVSSFCAEATTKGLNITSFDRIYELPAAIIRPKCVVDLDFVVESVRGLKVYKWDFYRNPDALKELRKRSYELFLPHYEAEQGRKYVAGSLPRLPFPDRKFDLTLVSYLLFVYEDQLDYDFHKQSVLDIMRVTRGEARMYPLVDFEAKPSKVLARMQADPDFAAFRFEVVMTDFEFLLTSNCYLRITRR